MFLGGNHHYYRFLFRIGPLTLWLTRYTEAASTAPSAILAMDVAIAFKIDMIKILLPILDVLRDEQDCQCDYESQKRAYHSYTPSHEYCTAYADKLIATT